MILTFFLLVISILLQLGCLHIAFKLYVDFYSNGSTKFWWWMWTGFMVMTFRRVTALLINLNIDVPDMGILDTLLLPFLVSVFLFMGMFYAYGYSKKRNHQLDVQLEKLKLATHKLRHSK